MCVCVCVCVCFPGMQSVPSPVSGLGEAKQPGVTGVFSEMEIYNMVTSLENRLPTIDLNEVRRCSALVDKRIVCSI